MPELIDVWGLGCRWPLILVKEALEMHRGIDASVDEIPASRILNYLGSYSVFDVEVHEQKPHGFLVSLKR